MVFYSFAIFIVTVLVNVHVVDLVRITNFYVPRRAFNQAEIDCKYDLDGKKLYDVKWYKDGLNFFRCAGDGTVHEYPVDGVMIRHSGSASVGACPLTLIVLTAKSSGEYSCEVSVDTDGFPMDTRTSRLDFLMPTKKNNTEIVPQGSEKHTSEEETEINSGCEGFSSKNIVLMMMYFILNKCLN